MTFDYAPEVRDIGEQLIRDVEDHKMLDHVRVEYVWRDHATRSKGRYTLGKARRVTGLNALLAGNGSDPFFVVEIAADTWEKLDESQRVALVDHELCHLHVEIAPDGTPTLSTSGHDLEEFGAVVERHGLWASDVANFGTQVAEQLALAVDEVSSFLENLGDDEEPTE